jgi:hypothetical protein
MYLVYESFIEMIAIGIPIKMVRFINHDINSAADLFDNSWQAFRAVSPTFVEQRFSILN